MVTLIHFHIACGGFCAIYQHSWVVEEMMICVFPQHLYRTTQLASGPHRASRGEVADNVRLCTDSFPR